ALALWVLHTHSFDAAYSTPYVNINSPVKGCGKTTNLEILGHLVAKPLFSSNITAPAVFRTVEKYQPTLLIDEADTFLGLNDELRGVLNSGNRKNTAFTIRLVGENYEPKRFSTWCPKVFALIGHLPGTLEDRSIGITMHRKTREEWVEEFNPNKITPELEMLRRKASRWAKDHLDALREADPPIPEELHNRTRDKWRPLLQIAEVAGGEWPELARKAALSLSAGANDEENSTGIKLLADIRALFDSKRSEVLSSEELVEALYEMEDRPWPDWKNGFGISKAQVARLLAPFGIKPKQLWIDEKNQRGYRLEWFEDAFRRYLPRNARSARTQQRQGFQQDWKALETELPSGSENAGNPYKPGVLAVLADGVGKGARTIKGGRDDY
ncbi:DUF3631 domain-containing protein, partial [Acidobacteria bacterium AH-259-G07]|nr:DUF3631 domain-containing protein [Acidobacteria bacterium AH-259-G07]